jgi:signal transduction histidine kinase
MVNAYALPLPVSMSQTLFMGVTFVGIRGTQHSCGFRRLSNLAPPIALACGPNQLSSFDSPRPGLQRTVGIMDRQISHVVHLVDDLLDISRITRGRIALKRERVSLTDVLANAIEASRPLIDAHAHELVVEVCPTVQIVVDGDLHRLAQIFSNLLCNSAKYTDRGGRITLSPACEGGEAVVDVRDSGIGIPPHALERVFDTFSQVQPNDARSEGGLGIGLSLVRTLTQLHGGSVSAASQGLGTGSVFTVRLPIVQDGTAASAAVAPIAP